MGEIELIEILPPQGQINAQVVVPGSKSVTNRALVLSALARGDVELRGALWSEDTQIMVECLRRLGYRISVESEAFEPCNRVIKVECKGGEVPRGGDESNPLELYVGNAGTAARFIVAMLAMGSGVYRVIGSERMNERPQAGLFNALRELGYRIESPNNKLPALIYGGGKRPGRCTVDISESTQFASALLLCSHVAGWEIKITGTNVEESPYIKMTEEMLKVFPHNGGVFDVEADASSGSYFIASGSLKKIEKANELQLSEPADEYTSTLLRKRRKYPIDLSVDVINWPTSGWQIDEAFKEIFRDLAGFMIGCGDVTEEQMVSWLGSEWRNSDIILNQKPVVISREKDLGDSILTLMAIAPLATMPIWFRDLKRLRLQECERVAAMRVELTKCGAKVVEEGDTLKVFPSILHGAEIETYNDHRIAMAFAVLGIRVPGIKIKNPACVKKTFPNFFAKLAEPPPNGTGIIIKDCKSGRTLSPQELVFY